MINFYEDGTQTNPLVVIDFDNGFVSRLALERDEVIFTADNVTITGSEITDALSDEAIFFQLCQSGILARQRQLE